MNKVIANKLHTLGFRSHYQGFNYIVRCIELCLNRNTSKINLRAICRKIAEEYHSSEEQIYMSIRRNLNYYWETYEDKILCSHMCRIDVQPKCKEFILILCQICV